LSSAREVDDVTSTSQKVFHRLYCLSRALLLGHVADLTEDDELAVDDVVVETFRIGYGNDVINLFS
jgi:hypothetical protein